MVHHLIRHARRRSRSRLKVALQLTPRGVSPKRDCSCRTEISTHATIVKRLGLEPEGLIRAGCACYTTEEEIDRLIAGVDEISEQSVRGAL